MVKNQKRSGEVGSIHVMEDKSLCGKGQQIIEGFSVGHFCALICVLELDSGSEKDGSQGIGIGCRQLQSCYIT